MESFCVDNIINCNICQNKFNDSLRCPRVLMCGHTFCHSCLEEILTQSRICPSCKRPVKVSKIDNLPINLMLQNCKFHVASDEMSSKVRNCPVQTDKMVKSTKRKLKYEGFCDDHENFNELRCMDCRIWVCGVCVSTQHKQCRTLLVEEAYEELKNQVVQKVDTELERRKAIMKKINERLKVLNEERKILSNELRVSEDRTGKLVSLKRKEGKFCDQLKSTQTLVENSLHLKEFSEAKRKLNKFLEDGTKLPEDLQLFMSLESWCMKGDVYAVECQDNNLYGKIRVKNGQILVHSFRSEKPDSMTIPFKNLLSTFNGSAEEIPNKTFLQLTTKSGAGEDIDVVIEIDRSTPRGRNFVLLCSALKGSTYRGGTLDDSNISGFYPDYTLFPSTLPVVEGIMESDEVETIWKKGDVYGMYEEDSYFSISMVDNEIDPQHKFGVVVSGLRNLEDLEQKDMQLFIKNLRFGDLAIIYFLSYSICI